MHGLYALGVAVLVMLGMAGCGDGDETTSRGELGALGDSRSPAVNVLVADEDIRAFPDISAIQQRKVISTASLVMTVTNPAEAVGSIGQLAQELGGWVVTSSVSKTSGESGGERIRAAITIRVPSESFHNALERIKTGGVSVETENLSGQDITQDYVDLQSQLTNLEIAEIQLQGIMDSASTIDNVLAVHNELVRVRGEIETTKGRLRYFDEATAYSSISVDLRSQAVSAEQSADRWSPRDTMSDALDALVTILQALADMVIVLVIIGLPLFLLVVLPGWRIVRVAQRRGWIQQKAQSPPADADVRESWGSGS